MSTCYSIPLKARHTGRGMPDLEDLWLERKSYDEDKVGNTGCQVPYQTWLGFPTPSGKSSINEIATLKTSIKVVRREAGPVESPGPRLVVRGSPSLRLGVRMKAEE